MKKNRKRGTDEEINFWQPASDMFSALLLILMLVILLLGLYLVHIPEYTLKDPEAGNTYADSDNGDIDATDTPEPTAFVWFPDGGGGGGSDGWYVSEGIDPLSTPTETDTVTPIPTPSPTPTPDLPGGGSSGGGGGEGGGEGMGEGPGNDPDMGMKSAVYVIMVDAETDRSVKEEGVQFELYGESHALQVLNVYYPERISFRFFETTESGTFYMPEKLTLGDYELHELTEPEGYDAADNVEFHLTETYDWADPLVVRVPIYPSRNIIRLRMTDAETGQPLSGAEFDVIAAENIITSDGTLRYRVGQTVSEIIIGENGSGESEEVYLGPYLLRQRVIPEYYTGLETELEVSVEKKTGILPPANALSSVRTKIRISLKDELYPTRGIRGATFSVSKQGSADPAVEAVTNGSGDILLDSLEKGVTYQITQTSSNEHYVLDKSVYSFQVSGDGRIDGESEAQLNLFNHMIRVSIGLTDEFSDIQVADVNLALYDAGGTLIRVWTTTGAPLMFTDLEAGNYYIIREDDRSTRLDIQVRDIAEVQNINLQTSYLLHYIIIAGIAALAVIVVVVAVIIIIRRRKKRAAAEEES